MTRSREKNVMISAEINKYSEIQIIHDAPAKAGLPTIETTQKILMQLDEDSALDQICCLRVS